MQNNKFMIDPSELEEFTAEVFFLGSMEIGREEVFDAVKALRLLRRLDANRNAASRFLLFTKRGHMILRLQVAQRFSNSLSSANEARDSDKASDRVTGGSRSNEPKSKSTLDDHNGQKDSSSIASNEASLTVTPHSQVAQPPKPLEATVTRPEIRLAYTSIERIFTFTSNQRAVVLGILHAVTKSYEVLIFSSCGELEEFCSIVTARRSEPDETDDIETQYLSRQQLDSINQEKEVYGVQVKKADTFSDLGCEGPVELRASLQPHLQGNHFLQSSRRQTSSAQPRRSFIAKSLQHFRQLSSQQTRPANISETNPTLAPLTSQRLHEARWRSADKAVSEKGVNGLQPPVYRMESTPLASRDDLPPIGTGRQSRYSQNSRSAGGPPVAVKAAKRSASLVSVTKFTINRESENSADMNRWPRKDRQGRLVYYECRASLISEHSVRPDSRYSQLEEERLLLKYYGKKPLGSCLLRFYDGTIYLKKLWKLSVKTYRNLISYRSILDIYTFTDYNTMLVIKMRRKNEDISYLVLNFRAGEALQRTRDIIISAMSNPESEVDNALYDPGISEGQQSPVSTHSGFDYDDPPLPDESVEPRVKHSITQLDRQERSYRAFYEFGFDPPPGRLASKASWPSMRPAHQPSVAMTSSYPRHGSLQLRPVFLSPHNQQEIPLVPEMMLVPGDRSGLPEERAWYTNDLAYASPSHPGPSFAARPRWYGLNPPVLQNNLMPNQSAHLASTISTGVNSLPDAYWSTNAIYSDLPLPSNGPFFTEPGISDHLRGRPNLQAAPRFPSRTASETDKSALMSSRRLPLQATNGARRNSLRRLGRSISVGSQAGEAHGLGNTSAQLSGGNFKSANEKTVILPVYVYTNDPAKLGNSLI